MIGGVTLVLLAIAMASAWFYSRFRHNYWTSKGVPSYKGLPFLGIMHRVMSKSQGRWVFDTEIYAKHGGSRFCGLYEMLSPVLMVGDPEVLKNILVKDFDHFSDRRTFKSDNQNDDIGNHMLTNINGDEWKTTRSIMTPTFTSGKMKAMFHMVSDKADALVSYCLDEASRNVHVDMKQCFGRYTVDTIATCAFGIECNSLVDQEAIFPKKAAVFFEIPTSRILKFVFLMTCPTLFKWLKIQMNPPELHFFKQVMQEALSARQKGQARGDFLDLLIEARENYTKDNLSSTNEEETDNNNRTLENDKNSNITKNNSAKVMCDDSVLAQSVLFLIVGYDTTASTLSFASHMLAKNPDAQQRLREEMQDMIVKEGSVTYQGIMEAKYLDAVIMETLRMFPPIPTSERRCTKDYKIPGTDVTIEAGTIIQYPIWCLHHDEKYWPEPYAFRPERFLPENKASIQSFTHVPFGMGPRNCIAMRFALMEAKIALAKMIVAAEMTLSPGYEELKLSTGPSIMRPEGGVHLILKPLHSE